MESELAKDIFEWNEANRWPKWAMRVAKGHLLNGALKCSNVHIDMKRKACWPHVFLSSSPLALNASSSNAFFKLFFLELLRTLYLFDSHWNDHKSQLHHDPLHVLDWKVEVLSLRITIEQEVLLSMSLGEHLKSAFYYRSYPTWMMVREQEFRSDRVLLRAQFEIKIWCTDSEQWYSVNKQNRLLYLNPQSIELIK